MELFDCIIVGGGPAGLNAAVILGRCRRRVIIFDTGNQRNRHSHGMHNYLTRDDILPKEFLKFSHIELKKYGVRSKSKKIINARKNQEGYFEVYDEDGVIYFSRKLLVATGLSDNIPEIIGIKEMYGKSVFHCPYCDGWEVKDKRIAVYARNKEGWELAVNLKAWSDHIMYFTDGKYKLKPHQKQQLEACEIPVIVTPIESLTGKNGHLEKIVLKTGELIECQALFFVNGYTQQCNLAEAFGCEMSKKGVVVTNRFQQTNIPGLYVAGDASRDMHFVVVAAAEGAKAGVIINKELQKEYSEKMLSEYLKR